MLGCVKYMLKQCLVCVCLFRVESNSQLLFLYLLCIDVMFREFVCFTLFIAIHRWFDDAGRELGLTDL